jgi:tetratricopeptide (TPR) repeat protein
MKPRGAPWLLAWSAVAFIALPVHADTRPSRWEKIRDPARADAVALHEAVHKRLLATTMTGLDLGERGRALAMLEAERSMRPLDPLLQFDLGFVYFLLENHVRAAEVYQQALKAFPDHPAAEQAWLRLAFACGHLGDHACERHAYEEVLRRETEQTRRATPTLNHAETAMHLGELQEAIAGYREALRLAGRMAASETTPLAAWGLAVALDRAGDTLEAEKQARFAIELETSMGLPRLLRSRDVFFVPAYEVNWYEGLGAIARARVAASVTDALALWSEAERAFQAYVNAAKNKGDRWLPLAKERLARASAERARLETSPQRGKSAKTPENEEFDL